MPQNDRINNAETHQNEVQLEGFLAGFRQALQEEIKEIKKNGQSSILLTEGHRLYTSSGYWYQFKIDYLPNIPADTPCKLTFGTESHEATVIAYDDNTITIDVKEEIPNTIAEAKLDNGATVLMELLIKRIESNSTKENTAGQRMMSAADAECKNIDDDSSISFDKGFNASQIDAIKSAVCNNMTFIWGPPGTGKTTVISHVISELLKRDRSVLLVSHTNSAVNGAIEKVDKKYFAENGDSSEGQYPILRLGSGGKELVERLQLDTQVEKVSHDLILQKEKLEKEYSEIQQLVKAIQISLTKIDWVGKTHVMSLEQLARQISEISNLIDSKRNELSELNTSIQEQLDTHPEYKEAAELKQTLETIEKEIASLNQDITRINDELKLLSEKLSNAKDEIAIHEQHKELKEKEAKYFSEKTLLSKIEECKSKIKSYEQLIDKNEKSISASKAIIQQYEAKSSLGKLFANKRDYEQAKSTLDRLSKANENNRRNLEAIKLTLQGYETQLIELTAIKSQLADLKPNKTKLYWESQMKTSISQKNSLELDLKQKGESLQELSLRKEGALSRLQVIGDVCNTIDNLFAHRKEVEDNLSHLHVRYSDGMLRFEELVVEENNLCHGVYFVQKTTDIENIEALKKSIENAKAEIVNVDSEKIKNEQKEHFKRQEAIETELKQLDEQITKVSVQVILNAKVIGTTLAKSYLSDEIQSRVFDTIILDEASMAAIPALWCAAQLAEKNIVIVGDFLQLPPIVMAETDMAKKWLGRDIFEVSAAQEMFRSGTLRPNHFVMLNEQYRMKEEIANVVNIYYKQYSGLKSNDKAERFIESETDFKKWYNSKFETDIYTSFRKVHSIHLMDTASLNAWVTSVPTGINKSSRLNAFSAVLSVELAFKLLEKIFVDLIEPVANPYVLIVAPYKPHIKRIEQIIQDKYHALGYDRDMNLIKAGTIHSFQGKEAEIVIFDLVIDEPHYIANLFMQTEEINNELQKLFNVAISRAKYKLFFVGNFNYCKKKAKTNSLGSLLDYLITKKKYPLIDAKIHFPNMTFIRPSSKGLPQIKYMMEICKEDAFFQKIKNDIQNAKKRIIIYSPFMTEKAVAPLLPYLKDAISKSCEVVVITKTIDEISPGIQSQKQKCESILTKSGIAVIHKKGMHEKIIIIDDDTVWIGSLNLFSFGGNTREIMCKIISKEGAKEFAEIYDIEHIIESVNHNEERTCPICGKEVIMAESDSAGYYWRCIDKDGCGWSRKPNEPHPVDGKLVCPKCGGEYVLSMKNEPRWICVANSRHYRKIRMADLKLVKMWEGVSKKAIKEVEDYFKALAKGKEAEKPKKKSKQQSKKSKTKTKSSKINTPDLFSNQGSRQKGKKDDGQLSMF